MPCWSRLTEEEGNVRAVAFCLWFLRSWVTRQGTGMDVLSALFRFYAQATSFPFLSPFSRIHPVITRVLAFILCVLLYHTHSGISLDKSTFLSLVCPENMTSCSLFEKLCRYQREDVHHQLTSTLIWVLDVTCLTMNINLHVKSL